MSFTGVEFAVFFPTVFLLYWVGPRRGASGRNWQNAILLLASVAFYATWSPRLLVVLTAAVATSFAAGVWLDARPTEGMDEAQAAIMRKKRKAIAVIAVIMQLGFLGLFKYAGFFSQSLNALLDAAGISDAMPVLRLALPLGISYTTLIQVGYLLEVYWERSPACRDPLAYSAFVAFFPQLIAGPIVRTRAMLPQYYERRALRTDDVAEGAASFLLGFAMKALVADWLSPNLVAPAFSNPGAYSAGALWIALAAYATQLFCDFAGYSLMAIGTGRLFGLTLPENFRYPFLSKSLPEFWRRWHISLNTWLFDYIFAPLTTGRSRFRGRVGAGFVVVFLASGLWHGPTWTFVLWGLSHGIAMAVHHAYDEWYKRRCRKDRRWVEARRSKPYGAAAWVLTQAFFLLTLVPFRSPGLRAAADFAAGLLGLGGGSGRVGHFGFMALFCAAFMVVFHSLQVGRGPALMERFRALPTPIRGVSYGLAMVFLLVFVPLGASTFIYAQF